MAPSDPLPSEIYPSPKRVRVVLGGEVIADSRRVLLLRREGAPPVYYFPRSDLREGVLEAGERTPGEYGAVQRYHARAGGKIRRDAAWSLLQPVAGPVPPADHVAFLWSAMDAWFEEDEEVFVHPRDPRVRLDILRSSVRVRVSLDGTILAESRRPVLLFETGLVTRYYLPKLDVQQQYLEPSPRVTHCPYKGEAHYHHARVGGRLVEDALWYYRYPVQEAAAIAGLLCFYQERVTVEVDEAPHEA